MDEFIDWNEFSALHGQSQQDMLERQMAELEAVQGQATHTLSSAQDEAARQQMAEAQMGAQTQTGLTNVGSYGDYLKLKQGMREKLAAMMAGEGGDFGALRGQILSGGMGEEAKGILSEMQRTEDARLAQSGEWQSGYNRLSAEEKARADKETAANAERQRGETEHRRQFYADVQSRWGDANAFNLFGRPGENRSDQTQLARMLAVGRASGDWNPQNTAQGEDVNAQAWGSPRGNSAVGTGVGGQQAERDAYGRVIDSRTGRPLYGFGETGT
jgi:hypothetical protein